MDHQAEMDYIRQILDGETRLYAYFLEQYGDPVYAMIRRIVDSTEESEELTQDVFVKAFNHLSSFGGKSRFSTWLFRIAYNTAISRVRKKNNFFPAVSEQALSRIADEELDAFLEDDQNEQRLRGLEKAINSLPPDEKALLDLYYKNEKPLREIALILGQSEANIKIRLFRLRKKLYLLVKNEGDE